MIRLTDRSLREAGYGERRASPSPALNPHAGDGGNFGREEIDIIAARGRAGEAKKASMPRALSRPTRCSCGRPSGAFDAVLTMYHDQGQIAMKLIGFDRGVTLLGGFPFPICTPAHGSAYDIAGKGVANLGASKAAVLLAAKMGRKGPGPAAA